MVTATDLKFYKSTESNATGGDIGAIEITSGTSNNLFTNVSRADQVTGKDYYRCMYIKNTSSEKMDEFSFWMTADTKPSGTKVKWAREDGSTQNKYSYHPYMTFNGSSDFIDVADDPSLDLNQFSVSCWFKTSANYTTEAALVNKGGFASESAGENMNYGLWMNSSEQIVGGFETSAGVDFFVTSPASYSDGKWHFALVTYDTVKVRLYVDGVMVNSLSTTATPETNAKPLTIGKNSRAADRYWNGQIDEVRVWDNNVLIAEVLPLYEDNIIPQDSSIVYENKFGDDNGSAIAQIIPNENTAPVGLTWFEAGSQPSHANFASLRAGAYKPIWIWWHVDANAEDTRNDRAIFSFKFNVTTGGTGTGGQSGGGGGGGGTGANPPPAPTDYKIAAVGDWGEEDETDDVINYIKDNDYDLVLGLGDNSYTGSDEEWYNIIEDIDHNQGSDIIFHSAMGNHDSKSSIRSHFHYPNTWTSFDFQNIHVVIIDTESDLDDGSSQHDFIERDIEAQQDRAGIDWIFAIMHRPAFSAESDHPANEFDQVQELMDILVNGGCSLWLTGHNHHWQSTYPIKRNGSSATKVINNSGPYTVGNPQKWLIHVVSGAGGHDHPGTLYDLDSEPSYNAYQNNSNNGILSIEGSNGGKTLTCKFINTSGSVKYSWVMNQPT